MKKNVLFIAMALITINLSAQKFWNFSDAIWGTALPVDFTTSTTIDELTINGTSSGVITIDANNKSIDGYSFTQRLKLGGTGTPTVDGRNVSFSVTGPCKITVYGMASSSGATDRSLVISDGTTELNKASLLGDKIYKLEYNYTGGEATLYLYSDNSGLNFYGIKVDETLGTLTIDASKVVRSVEYFDLTGRKVSNENRKNAVLIKKITYADGTTSSGKVITKLD
ncbi:MAG: hypothetical protein LBB85_04250 [Dysgonamonadaceae bacterium]|jgi:hypothetical protein|nr:hypothetical protein [Dysgonamonadaceae bacterium]